MDMTRIFTPTYRAFIVAMLAMNVISSFTVFADGLPGEAMVTQRWRALFSDCSPLSNPAFINEANYISGRLAWTNTLGEFNMLETGVTIPIGLYQAAGFTWLLQSSQPYPATTVDASGNIVQESGSMISDQENLFMFSYANNVWID